MEKTIEIRYFAILREEAKKDKEIYKSSAETAAQLYEELKADYDFSLDATEIKLSLNQKYAALDSEIKDGDQLVFIPPVAGG